MAKPIIQLKSVSVVYQPGEVSEVWGARDVSLEIFTQEYIVFFGPSGSGKSTLLNLIAGLEKPSKGQVIVNDQDVSKISEQALIEFHRTTTGIIFQAFYLISNLSVKDNILLPQMFRKLPKKVREQKLASLAARFGIGEVLVKKPNELSGGQQQRVAAARALINDPLIVLADEPVGNLDSKNAEITMQLLQELNLRDRKTVILVTHDPRYLPYADRIYYVKDGSVEKVVVNHKKQKIDSKAVSELDKLAQSFPYYSSQRLMAKLVLNEVLLPYSYSDLEKVEEVVEKYLLKKATSGDIQKVLDDPYEKGGIDMYSQKAKQTLDKILDLLKQAQAFAAKPGAALSQQQLRQLSKSLIAELALSLTLPQQNRLNEILLQRMADKISDEEVFKRLDLPFKDGGVGLNKRTAHNLSRKIQSIFEE